MTRTLFARTAAVVLLTALAVLPAAAQEATPTATPEPPPNCPAFEGQPNDVRTGYYMGEGIAYLNANRLGDAELSFTCVIRVIDTSYVPAYLARAEVYTNLRDFQRAIDDYNAAVLRDNNLIAALNNRGIAQTILGDYTAAAADFDRVLDIDADYLPAYNNRSIIHTLQGEYQAAIDLITQGIERSGADNALAQARDPERPEGAPPVQIGDAAVRLYALRGILESARSLESFRSYVDLANASGRFPDERVTGAAGSLESRMTFELRLDDGSWMLRTNFLSGS
jgi:tetratricopeptide (TPR) repeat protein